MNRRDRERFRSWRLWRRFFPSGRLVFADVRTWTTVDVPVIDGIATLPDGRTVASQAQVVRVPVLH